MFASAISFFIVKGRAKLEAAAKPAAGLTKAEKAAIRAYFAASPEQRKAMLKADRERPGGSADPEARRTWRRNYMRQYRALKRLLSLRF